VRNSPKRYRFWEKNGKLGNEKLINLNTKFSGKYHQQTRLKRRKSIRH
jgi:hypothetical protein